MDPTLGIFGGPSTYLQLPRGDGKLAPQCMIEIVGFRNVKWKELGVGTKRSATALALCFIAYSLPCPVQAEYRLQAGDEIEINILNLSDSKTAGVIESDSTLTVPFCGQMKAGGLTISEFRDSVQDAITKKSIRKVSASGQEIIFIIDKEDINVRILNFRPVYVTGDVAKPGEIKFRPGLTIPQAIALAGGLDVMRIRMENPFLTSIDEKAQYETLRIEYAKESLRLLRLQAEAEGINDFAPRVNFMGLPRAVAEQMVETEKQRFQIRRMDLEKERASLLRQKAQVEKQLSDLRDQQIKEEEGVQADTAELSAATDLLKRGTTITTRVTDSRRALLLSSTRYLQTTSLISQRQREFEELSRRIEKNEDIHKLELNAETQETRVKLDSIKSRMVASSEKLVYTGMVKSQLTREGEVSPQVTLTRRNGGLLIKKAATDSSDLEPGDLLDISLRSLLQEEPSRPTGR
ncbi:polysaccharide biosynthesis/export family protein [Alsobacter sp. SYSU BS001988]